MWFLKPKADLQKTQRTPKANHNGRPPPQYHFNLFTNYEMIVKTLTNTMPERLPIKLKAWVKSSEACAPCTTPANSGQVRGPPSGFFRNITFLIFFNLINF